MKIQLKCQDKTKYVADILPTGILWTSLSDESMKFKTRQYAKWKMFQINEELQNTIHSEYELKVVAY